MVDRVQTAVDQLASALGRSVLVEDPHHQPLSWSVQDVVDGARLRTILQRSVDPAAVAMVARMGLARASGPVRTPTVPEADMVARWCVPLRHGGPLLGYLWVLDGDRTVTEDDLPRVVAVADLVAGVLASNTRAADEHAHRRAALLRRLAEGHDHVALQELLALERLDSDVSVVVQAPPRRGGWDLDGATSVHVVDSAARAAVGTAAGAAVDTATSGRPVALADLHVAVTRAMITARVLRAGARLEHVSWDALGAWRLVVAAADELAPSDVHPGADALAELPRSELLTTAWTVLEHGGDVAASAARLHIHRTTLYYRLDRVAALIGVDLRTGTERLDLHLALRLAAYRRAAE